MVAVITPQTAASSQRMATVLLFIRDDFRIFHSKKKMGSKIKKEIIDTLLMIKVLKLKFYF